MQCSWNLDFVRKQWSPQQTLGKLGAVFPMGSPAKNAIWVLAPQLVTDFA